MTDYHESWEALSDEARDIHRALMSFKEEIEAVDWYHQRFVMAADDELKAILAHNRDEEMEHACMTLEWLRRNMASWDGHLRTYLFTEAPITEVEEMAEEGGGDGEGSGDLGIGKPEGGR